MKYLKTYTNYVGLSKESRLFESTNDKSLEILSDYLRDIFDAYDIRYLDHKDISEGVLFWSFVNESPNESILINIISNKMFDNVLAEILKVIPIVETRLNKKIFLDFTEDDVLPDISIQMFPMEESEYNALMKSDYREYSFE